MKKGILLFLTTLLCLGLTACTEQKTTPPVSGQSSQQEEPDKAVPRLLMLRQLRKIHIRKNLTRKAVLKLKKVNQLTYRSCNLIPKIQKHLNPRNESLKCWWMNRNWT